MTVIKEISKLLLDLGFYTTDNIIVLHHLRKDFADYDVVSDAYFIRPVGDDFIHVAVVQYVTSNNDKYTQVRYAISADDLLFGLRVKFNQGDPSNRDTTLQKIANMTVNEKLEHNQFYIRKRFNSRTRTKAKVRAFFVMVTETWSKWFGK